MEMELYGMEMYIVMLMRYFNFTAKPRRSHLKKSGPTPLKSKKSELPPKHSEPKEASTLIRILALNPLSAKEYP